jgi:phosphoglycolate phosphatase
MLKEEIRMKPPIVVFDLDGTLVDTAPDLVASMNHALASVGKTPIDDENFSRFVGQGARIMLERAYRANGDDLPGSTLDALLADFLEHYRANMPGASAPYDGVMQSIDTLSSLGYLVAVCTNKTEDNAVRLLEKLGISDGFSAICGQDTFPMRKPDPQHLLLTIERAGGDPGRALMVGDSETDIVTAKRAGIPVVAVDFGYTDRPVTDFDPDHIISHFETLVPPLVESLIGKVRAAG